MPKIPYAESKFSYEDLPENKIDAFLEFEDYQKGILISDSKQDREFHTERDGGYYIGYYEPERLYVASILAFIHEYEIDVEIADNVPEENSEFLTFYKKFGSELTYIKTRLKLRSLKEKSGSFGTPILVQDSYKEEITNNLNTIRKIVLAKVSNDNKKEAILKKISSLQFEVDRDRTTIDAMFAGIIDLSKVLGSAGTELEPAVDKIERIMRALKDGSEILKLLPRKKLKQIEYEKTTSNELEDEIPF